MNETDNTGTMRNAGEDVEELLSCSELILVHSVVLVFMWFQPTESLCARIAIISSSKGVCWPCRWPPRLPCLPHVLENCRNFHSEYGMEVLPQGESRARDLDLNGAWQHLLSQIADMVIVVLETDAIWKQCVQFTAAVFRVVLVRWN